jgi:hypothetical protein
MLVHKFMDMENIQVLFAWTRGETSIFCGKEPNEAVNVAEILNSGEGGTPRRNQHHKQKDFIQVKDTAYPAQNLINHGKTAKDIWTSL